MAEITYTHTVDTDALAAKLAEYETARAAYLDLDEEGPGYDLVQQAIWAQFEVVQMLMTDEIFLSVQPALRAAMQANA